ncbi:secreted RxLR effector protein 161-like [Vicia villosa]|uniref:secreted RxLR effector protein 161-like n=1 Tax=Vicia villosa TaxID=3911 RepID=UPI00273B7924|nr:secreted RxLR effector protein 161-like [Vicia villosa]
MTSSSLVMIRMALSESRVAITQRTYALDIPEGIGLLDYQPSDTLMNLNVKLLPCQGEPLKDPGRYRCIVGKLNYLTAIRPDITFVVNVVSQFLNALCDDHWNGVIRILKYIKSASGKGLIYENKGITQVVGYSNVDWAGSLSDRRSTLGYCILIGGNMISWRSKKQNIVARSIAEAEYNAMAATTCELTRLKQLFQQPKL